MYLTADEGGETSDSELTVFREGGDEREGEGERRRKSGRTQNGTSLHQWVAAFKTDLSAVL